MPNLRLTLFLVSLGAAATARAEAPAKKPEPLKNMQVMKSLSRNDVTLSMRFISSSLGVDCAYCHVTAPTGQWPMEKDDKEAKRTARKMITMQQKINHQFFGGNQVVTCATCHKGRPEPASATPLDVSPADREAADADAKPPAVTAQELLDKYAQAAGGKAAWEKLHTRVAKGKLVVGPGQELGMEVTLSGPNKYCAKITTPRGAATQVFDGKEGWFNGGNGGTRTLSPWDRADAERDAQLYTPIKLGEIVHELKVLPDATVGKTAVHVLQGRAFGAIEQLQFDAKSGLLVRRIARSPTPLGDFVERLDYEDYKSVDGVMVPFTVKRNSGGELQIEKYTSIQHNVPVDDKLFVRPAP